MSMRELGEVIRDRALRELNPPGVPSSFRRRIPPREENIASILKKRERGGARIRKYGTDRPEHFWAEAESTAKHQSQYFELPPTTKSTISIAISPDGKTFASTHGDHTIKIICMQTGRILQTLVGHPRTPWSVKFHPTNPRYIASGCLGYEVRFWDIESGRCLYVSMLRHAIISISFHPSGDIIAIASGTCVYTWDYQHTCPRIAMFSYQTLRSVTFLPDPTKIMVGEANERYMRAPGQNGPANPTDLTVTLTVWDFDPAWSLAPTPFETKKAMTQGRVVLSHALIYNDGGFDISRCGRYLAVCADFSLRQAENDCELEVASDIQQILSMTSTAPSLSPTDSTSVQDMTLQSSESTSSISSEPLSLVEPPPAVAPLPMSMPIPPTSSFSIPAEPVSSVVMPAPSRLFPNPPFPSSQAQEMQTLLPAPPSTASISMDHYMHQHLRRVRPRLHPSGVSFASNRSYNPANMSPSMGGTTLSQRHSTQIRPNIAISRTRQSRPQRSQRTRLAALIQSTWLALISLDPHELGRVIQTCYLEETTAGGVTSVKLSPTSAFVLLGYGVRDRGPSPTLDSDFPVHRVTRIYRWEDNELRSHVESERDDVNIALFSPICGGGFLYGTKQGKLRVCSTYRGPYQDEANCNRLRCENEGGSPDEEDEESDEHGDDDDGIPDSEGPIR